MVNMSENGHSFLVVCLGMLLRTEKDKLLILEARTTEDSFLK